MKRFQVTLMVPQVQVIEASSAQDAHNHVSKMLAAKANTPYPHPSLHSIEEMEEIEITFEPDFEIE